MPIFNKNGRAYRLFYANTFILITADAYFAMLGLTAHACTRREQCPAAPKAPHARATFILFQRHQPRHAARQPRERQIILIYRRFYIKYKMIAVFVMTLKLKIFGRLTLNEYYNYLSLCAFRRLKPLPLAERGIAARARAVKLRYTRALDITLMPGRALPLNLFDADTPRQGIPLGK